jgi:hypothetical protein
VVRVLTHGRCRDLNPGLGVVALAAAITMKSKPILAHLALARYQETLISMMTDTTAVQGVRLLQEVEGALLL